MKVKTLLKQQKTRITSELKVWSALLVLALLWPNKYTWSILAFATCYLIMDIVIVIRIKRKAKRDPEFLNVKTYR